MKMMSKLFTIFCLTILTSAVSIAAAETIDLSTFGISMDLQGIGPYNVQKGVPSSSNHNYGGYAFAYQFFPATVTASNTDNRVEIGVFQLSNPEPLDVPIPILNMKTGLEHTVEESNLMPSGRDIQKQQYYIDGNKGIAMTINRNQGPIYVAAYSPDMRDGLGKTVVIIGSDFPIDVTKSIFESVKTQSIQDNMMGQNMGQSYMGMANAGQNNAVMSNTGQGNVVMSNMGQSSMGGMSQSNTGQSGMNVNPMETGIKMIQAMANVAQSNSGKGQSMNMGSMKM